MKMAEILDGGGTTLRPEPAYQPGRTLVHVLKGHDPDPSAGAAELRRYRFRGSWWICCSAREYGTAYRRIGRLAGNAGFQHVGPMVRAHQPRPQTGPGCRSGRCDGSHSEQAAT